MGRFAVMLAAALLCVACGQIYRPVVIPTQLTPPTPANFHTVFGLDANVPGQPGAAVQIDVSGDSVVGQTPTDPNGKNVGILPTHLAVLPSQSRLFVASAGGLFTNGTDLVAALVGDVELSAVRGLGKSDGVYPYGDGIADGIQGQVEHCNRVGVVVGHVHRAVLGAVQKDWERWN